MCPSCSSARPRTSGLFASGQTKFIEWFRDRSRSPRIAQCHLIRSSPGTSSSLAPARSRRKTPGKSVESSVRPPQRPLGVIDETPHVYRSSRLCAVPVSPDTRGRRAPRPQRALTASRSYTKSNARLRGNKSGSEACPSGSSRRPIDTTLTP